MPEPLSAAGVNMTFAPSARIIFLLSIEKVSTIVATKGWPSTAQTIARAMPVLPEVASITVWPSLSFPDFRASLIIAKARRSLQTP